MSEEDLMKLIGESKSDDTRKIATAIVEWIKSQQTKITESEPEPEN